jgi:hypothetical protein
MCTFEITCYSMSLLDLEAYVGDILMQLLFLYVIHTEMQ